MRTLYQALVIFPLLVAACGGNEIYYPDIPEEDESTNSDATSDPVEGDVEDESDTTTDGDVAADTSLDFEACEAGDTATITPEEGGNLSFEVGTDQRVSFTAEAGAVAEDLEVTLSCATSELDVTDDYIVLSRPVVVGFDGALVDYATIRIPFAVDEIPENARPSSVRLLFAPATGAPLVSPPAVDLQENLGIGYVTFASRHPGTYVVAVAANAGETYERTWRFRAITGVSMGCSGASMVGTRNPEEFDIIGALGGPTSWVYLSHYIKVGGMGGFKTAEEGWGSGPAFVPTQELEHAQTFDNFWSPTGEGSGGTFDRPEYIKIFQDLALTFGNISNYSPDSPFLPPGVDASELTRTHAERCNGTEPTLTIEEGFYDDEYNPDGSMPVIMFCDGRANRDATLEFDRYCDLDENGTPDEANQGLYPGPENQPRPVMIAWAVDVNGNGVRDFGEPVIRNSHEPYEDVGEDGLADEDEEGYDAVTRPDPAGDNYDYYVNPTGTEGNWLWEEGEPYQDYGLDGVDDTPQLDEDGYDFGEGNGEFDLNPHLAALLAERDPHGRVGTLTQEQWDGLTFYMDAGVRDLFNFAVSTNQLSGAIAAAGENMRIYDGFFSLANLDPEEDDYRFAEVEYDDVGDHVYLRYGDVNASEEDICWGDGKHVGTVPQIANRLLTMLGLITNRFPGGDFTELEPPYPTPSGNYLFESESLDAFEEYSIILPPGYEWHHCNDGEDNDGDGLVDGDDSGCAHGTDNSEEDGLGESLCNDGIDNDDDQLVDFPDDPDCQSADDTSEWPVDHPMRDATFPVVMLLHGYGQTPDDLRAAVVPFAGFMAGGLWQKVIVVYPDGFCGDNDTNQCNDGIDNDEDEIVDGEDPDCAATNGAGEDADNVMPFCSDGVDNDGDGLVDDEDGGCISSDANDESECMKGNFYSDHAAWPDGSGPGPNYEEAIFDLLDHIDATYRTRAPETTVEVR